MKARIPAVVSLTLATVLALAVGDRVVLYGRTQVPAAASNPIVILDLPVSNGTVGRMFEVGGWAIDRGASTGTGVSGIHVWAYSLDGAAPKFLGVPEYGRPRDDVAAVFGQQFRASGFRMDAVLPNGRYVIGASAWSLVQNGFVAAQPTTISVSWTDAVTVTQLHEFSNEAPFPNGWIQSRDGAFYGTTFGGGAFGRGTVVRMTSEGAVTVLHSFSGTDGEYPTGKLLEASDGNFYGTTMGYPAASEQRYGTLFRMTPSGVVTVLHAFTRQADGAGAWGQQVVEGLDGNFYFLALGWFCGRGKVLRMTPGGTLSTVYAFGEACAQGYRDPFELIQASDGNFYGTTLGSVNVIFRLTPEGLYTELHQFSSSDSVSPGLLQASDGNFYGGFHTVRPVSNCGSIFRMSQEGAFEILHTFNQLDGCFPAGGRLVEGVDGHLYGSTYSGGVWSGVLFRMTKAGGFSVLSDTNNPGISIAPDLIQAADGQLYGTFYRGGATGGGTAFRVTLANPIMSIDGPASGASLPQPFRIGGWAADLGAAEGAGVDTLHVWAFPVSGGSPTFAGVAAYGQPRADVGAVFGAQFDNSGYILDVSGLTVGQTYDIGVYAHSAVSGTFNQVKFVRVTIP